MKYRIHGDARQPQNKGIDMHKKLRKGLAAVFMTAALAGPGAAAMADTPAASPAPQTAIIQNSGNIAATEAEKDKTALLIELAGIGVFATGMIGLALGGDMLAERQARRKKAAAEEKEAVAVSAPRDTAARVAIPVMKPLRISPGKRA